MRTRQLRARLDRLAPSAHAPAVAKSVCPYEFPIDPALAKAIHDDVKRLEELRSKRDANYDLLLRRNVPEPEEERTLRERIAERAQTISCPPGYGFNEYWDDQHRPLEINEHTFYLSEWLREIPLYDIDDVDAERVQVSARTAAYEHSPEGRARRRLNELQSREDHGYWITEAEYAESRRLEALYPEPNVHPKNPAKMYYSRARRSFEDWKRLWDLRRRYDAEKSQRRREDQVADRKSVANLSTDDRTKT